MYKSLDSSQGCVSRWGLKKRVAGAGGANGEALTILGIGLKSYSPTVTYSFLPVTFRKLHILRAHEAGRPQVPLTPYRARNVGSWRLDCKVTGGHHSMVPHVRHQYRTRFGTPVLEHVDHLPRHPSIPASHCAPPCPCTLPCPAPPRRHVHQPPRQSSRH